MVYNGHVSPLLRVTSMMLHQLTWIIMGMALTSNMLVVDAQQQQHQQQQRSSAGTNKRPHIILIVADDLGYNDVSFHGSNQIPTPNIDFLAYNGVILNNYYVSPICTPTRSALMTGRHPIHTGMQHAVIFGPDPYGLPLKETLMPQYLKKLGYRSHMIGKWHLGMYRWEYTPTYRGFESHFGYLQGCEDYFDHTYEYNPMEWGLDFWRDKDLVRNCSDQYSTTLFRDEAVKIIDRHDATEPLFLYLPFQAVHAGNFDGAHLQAPESYIEKFEYIHNYERRIYAAMVSALDDAVGDIYDSLKKKEMLANSIIIFTTDNGGPANGFDRNAANNFPLRGVKDTLWEGGVRGVGLIHSPLLHRQGYTSDKMLHVCDWLPTLLSAAGGDHLIPNTTSLDGVNAWEMLSTDGAAVRSEILHNIDPKSHIAAIRFEGYKLLVGKIDFKWGGWYPPYQLPGDEHGLHYLNYKDDAASQLILAETEVQRRNLTATYKNNWPQTVWDRMAQLYSYAEKSDLYTGPYASLRFGFRGEYQGSNHKRAESVETQVKLDMGLSNLWSLGGTPVEVKCGPKPANASTNCHPTVLPCLYHITSDPCEYNNIASENPEIVKMLLDRLEEYHKTMVPPRNKPADPAANPVRHGDAWVPWK